MAGAVTEVSVNGDDWTVLAQDVTEALVQLTKDGPVYVAVAAAKPSAGSNVGIILTRESFGLSAVPIINLASGTDIVYGKCKNTETENVTVLTTGGA